MLANPSAVIWGGTVSTKIGLPQSGIYASSKAVLCSLGRTLLGELISRNIRFNCLIPGSTATPAHIN
ncbi:SDR family oxidoreductase [Snodgrassella gandavensis]|uniref:SDR family oxidoreductase n=1 Tax=Snodgrassella gandavensis TaxID=2946698 RepID=UPI0023B290EA|nr:SDR family oxidoreductase [Snodgrassella gandavensis]